MKEIVFGKEMGRMPDIAFRIMGLIFVIRDLLTRPQMLLEEFGILPGHVVVDYGCGTGSYLAKASSLAGEKGRVYAVDLHELAIESVEKRIRSQDLSNVTGVLCKDGKCPIDDRCVDVIYALDMFHMVSDTKAFLMELNRISKESSRLYIDNGHQKRVYAREKILASGLWEIQSENERYMVCRPVV